VLNRVPPKHAKVFYYMYADFEENFGLLNHAMEIYDRACKELTENRDRYEVLNLQIAKSADFYGISRTRQLFERAFELLTGSIPDLIQMGLRFAKMERKLGEVDRARAIYQHVS
jgi:pre-mRNA-splicing factor SYF1